MKKLKSKLGETISETLVALLISTFALMILAGAVVSAATINSRISHTDVVFSKDAAESGSSTVTISMDGSDITPVEVSVDVYTTENGYIYYEKKAD